jgi:hypothetical protein
MNEFVIFGGREFKVFEAFGGWDVNGAMNSGCYDYGGRSCHPC